MGNLMQKNKFKNSVLSCPVCQDCFKVGGAQWYPSRWLSLSNRGLHSTSQTGDSVPSIQQLQRVEESHEAVGKDCLNAALQELCSFLCDFTVSFVLVLQSVTNVTVARWQERPGALCNLPVVLKILSLPPLVRGLLVLESLWRLSQMDFYFFCVSSVF